ncbi:hypothetical protein GN958_ATG02541 [Phytophthora infestans]|uniref:PiggyBac transposable element-derived protein domain-containing protein n=1 Tax=Phytophthora infestans TaxID=4787 RepID=A0A8S9V7V8_PHYIN|nr:hypothetical protein GN958_ATG16257 [Phytophthora infestans]KAF4140064.1 hypothetical protein GN958_ATG10814 [Phytophthora infestans]KAF4148217.1 hypothetical protein GN958_ATG02541 [Phytophthora infestans]
MLISNSGTKLPGTDSIRIRHRLVTRNGKTGTIRYEKKILRPQMVERFFSKFSSIDVHDHLRQGSLAIEREWITRSSMYRVFATLLVMDVTDSYLAYRYEIAENCLHDETILDFSDFVSQLSHQLIFNEHTMLRSTRRTVLDPDEDHASHTRMLSAWIPVRFFAWGVKIKGYRTVAVLTMFMKKRPSSFST